MRIVSILLILFSMVFLFNGCEEKKEVSTVTQITDFNSSKATTNASMTANAIPLVAKQITEKAVERTLAQIITRAIIWIFSLLWSIIVGIILFIWSIFIGIVSWIWALPFVPPIVIGLFAFILLMGVGGWM